MRSVGEVGFEAKDGMQMTETVVGQKRRPQLTSGALCQKSKLTTQRHLSGLLAPISMKTTSLMHTHAHEHTETGPQMEHETQQRVAPAGESS